MNKQNRGCYCIREVLPGSTKIDNSFIIANQCTQEEEQLLPYLIEVEN